MSRWRGTSARNDGTYARIAAESADLVVAFDADHATVDALYRRLRDEGRTDILPLVMSVTDPSPDLGWRGRERASLERRGTPELALCLAVVHHVCITGNVPVREFLDWLGGLGATLVIEFPDRADPMVQRLLSGKRDGANPDYERAHFERALGERFDVERSEAVSETRTLYEARPRAVTRRGVRRADRVPARRAAPRRACGRSRSPSRCSTCSAATRSSSSRAAARAATSCCSRSATRSCRRCSAPRSCGRSVGSARRPGWARARSCSSRCSSPRSLLPPAGDALGGSGARARRRAGARRARRAALRARRRRCAAFLTVLSPAPLVVLFLFLVVSPVHDLLLPGDATAAVAGPGRAPRADRPRRARRAAGDDAHRRERPDRRRAVPEPRAARRGRDVVPPRDDRRRPHDRGGARPADRRAAARRQPADGAPAPAQPVLAVRATATS